MALDFLDDFERVGLKRAYVKALAEGRVDESLPKDPYDAVAPLVADFLDNKVGLRGKVEVPGWLTPRPGLEDLEMIREEAYREFMDKEGTETYIKDCAKVAKGILPKIPVMIAVDHSLSSGLITALSQRHGPEALAIVVLDSHFDAVPADLRAPLDREISWSGEGLCGDFFGGLMSKGLILANLIEFDMLFGHRNNVEGYARALEAFDSQLPSIMEAMRPGDVLCIAADHGNDPTTPSTDHSREYVPLLVYGERVKAGVNLGTRESFADVGATIAELFDVGPLPNGVSFAREILQGT